jgi:preprotein translocase subunit SecG
MLIMVATLIVAVGIAQGYFLIDTIAVGSYASGASERLMRSRGFPGSAQKVLAWMVFLFTTLTSILTLFLLPALLAYGLIEGSGMLPQEKEALKKLWVISFLIGLFLIRLIRERVKVSKTDRQTS